MSAMAACVSCRSARTPVNILRRETWPGAAARGRRAEPSAPPPTGEPRADGAGLGLGQGRGGEGAPRRHLGQPAAPLFGAAEERYRPAAEALQGEGEIGETVCRG